ncbi:hypothetical protein GQ457_01G035980 [Hibiscus cannabinus]
MVTFSDNTSLSSSNNPSPPPSSPTPSPLASFRMLQGMLLLLLMGNPFYFTSFHWCLEVERFAKCYLNEVVVHSLEKCVEVLSTCETLPPIAEELGITNRCVDAIAMNACKEQLCRDGNMLEAKVACRLELEGRIAFRLEMVSLDDLLIPSLRAGDSLFDVDTVHRILVNFLQQIEDEENEDCGGYESDGLASLGHGSLLKVGRLIDSYLAEIAPDPYLSLQKFIAMIEILPDYARVIDDGLYRAIDIS